MKKLIIVLSLASIFAFSGTVLADQVYGGFGLNPVSGQQSYVADGIMNVNVAYEPADERMAGWRFSYMMINFEQSDANSNTIKSQIFSAEQLFTAVINPNLSLIGAFGPGLFLTSVNTDKNRNGIAIGLSAVGSVRYLISDKLFIEGAYHYSNCAVEIGDGSVDAGYQGLFINLGTSF